MIVTKICLVGSSGGHLTQLIALRKWWDVHDRFWVTFNKMDASSRLQNERAYWCYYPTNRNWVNLIKNSLLAFRILVRERPNVIVSTGAGAAVPFFWIGKTLGIKTVFIEVFDRIDLPTLTGRLVYPVTDYFLVQWNEQLKFYPKAIKTGSVFSDLGDSGDS